MITTSLHKLWLIVTKGLQMCLVAFHEVLMIPTSCKGLLFYKNAHIMACLRCEKVLHMDFHLPIRLQRLAINFMDNDHFHKKKGTFDFIIVIQ
jgi:hypothetical protein